MPRTTLAGEGPCDHPGRNTYANVDKTIMRVRKIEEIDMKEGAALGISVQLVAAASLEPEAPRVAK